MAKRAAKTASVNLRIAPTERQLIERAARKAHLNVGTWMRQTCLRVAEQEVGADERRARLTAFIRSVREGKVAPAAAHARDVERERGDGWRR